MMLQLEGKVAVVTGGGISGIGARTTDIFIEPKGRVKQWTVELLSLWER